MDRADVVLGREWLFSLESTLTNNYKHNSLYFMANGKHVLLLGERNIPPTPLICTTEISFLEKANVIEEVFLCIACLEFFLLMFKSKVL